MSRITPIVPLLGLLFASGASASSSTCHTYDQSTQVWDGNGGPWLTGHVYILKATVGVPSGQTLTIQPGAIVKFDSKLTARLWLDGKLDAKGTSTSPIWFTSLKDDAAGGDHNGDGAATTPAAGDWPGPVIPFAADPPTFEWVRIRYSGFLGAPTIQSAAAGLMMKDCTIEDSAGHGVEIDGIPIGIERCAFDRCQRPVNNLAVVSIADFVDNTASGNTQGDVLFATNSASSVVVGDTTWSTANALNGEIHILSRVEVAPNVTLTIEAGVRVKWTHVAAGVLVKGALVTNGTATAPVVFTSDGDPAYGGSGGVPGDWKNLYFNGATSPSVLSHTVVRYGGQSAGAIWVFASDVTLASCTVAHSGVAGLYIANAHPSVVDCFFEENATYAIAPVPLDVLAGFSGNQASGNGQGDFIALGGGTLSQPATLSAASAFNGTDAFVLAGSFTIGAAGALTVAPGVVVKADPAANVRITVDGVLTTNGTASDEVTFTSLYDDSIGGDLNEDQGATTPAPGDWEGLAFGVNADASALNHTRLRYAGTAGAAAIALVSTDLTLQGVVVEDCDGPALDGDKSAPTVTGCDFDFCGGDGPIVNLPLTSITGLSDNGAQGNANGDSIRFAGSSLDAPLTLSAPPTLNGDGVYVFSGGVTVQAAGSLTVDEGISAKFTGGYTLSARGPLVVNGTEQKPVAFTSIADDDFGGDTEKDGPSNGSPGDWRGLDLFFNSGSSFSWTVVRYTGESGAAAVVCTNADPVFDHVTIEHGAATGVECATGGIPTLTDCAIDSCALPVTGVTMGALVGWSGNTAQGNAGGDVIRFGGLGTGADLTVAKGMSLNDTGTFVTDSDVGVSPPQTLTIDPGVTLKFDGARRLDVGGTLLAIGTTGVPIVFTSIRDDDHGGDSNGDGAASPPAPGDWIGLSFGGNADASVLQNALIRYAGAAGSAAVTLSAADITLCDVTIEHSAGAALDTTGTSAPTLKNVSFLNNGAAPILGATWGLLGKMTGTVANGNGGGDYTQIDSPLVAGNLTIHQENVLGSCIVVNVTPVTNGTTNTLTIGRGVVIKAGKPDVQMNVEAVLGTGLEKVVFTSFHDDVHGGDVDVPNLAPAPGDWLGVRCSGGSVEHALIRYAGGPLAGSTEPAGLRGTMSACVGTRVDFSAGHGFDATLLGSVGRALVAYQNAGIGMRVGTVWASTAFGNGDLGISGYAAAAYGCISWMNGPSLTENYAYSGDQVLQPEGVDVVWSCGTTLNVGPPTGFGGNCGSTGWGNFYGDPRFVDAANGDLTLKADSPCRNYFLAPCPPSILNDGSMCNPWGPGGAAYPGPAAPARDHVEAPRSIDDDLAGPGKKRADLGAHERSVFELVPIGDPVLGTTVQVVTTGPAGTSVYLLGLDGVDVWLDPYGWLLIDPGLVLNLATLPVGTPLHLPLPDVAAFEGLEVNIQAAVAASGGGLETTNVWRPRFRR